MTVRPFDWRDLPNLHRFRQQSVFLDSTLLLTRGPQLVPGALLSSLAPGMGVFTCVFNGANREESPIIGQFIHSSGAQQSHLTFITPQEALESANFSTLLDYMVWASGGRGATRLLADVDEHSPAFEALRKAGFAIYTRQRIWQADGRTSLDVETGQELSGNWRAASDLDTHAIRSLYHNLVPGLVQQVEPYVTERPRGLVYYQADKLIAYVELKYGHRGVWVQPFVHPDTEDVLDLLAVLLGKIPNSRSRPLYICVRSYQSWLELAIDELGATASSPQAVMVRHLAIQQKAERQYALPALEGGQPEISAPIVRSESKENA